MEQENVTMADASGANDSHGSNIRLCPLCNKPKEKVAFKRHAAYCKKQQDKLKKRKRSCKNCRRAKSKCSFELQCFRCRTKGWVCEYDKPLVVSSGQEVLSDAQDMSTSTSERTESSPVDSSNSPAFIETGINVLKGTTGPVDLQTLPPPRLLTNIHANPSHQPSILFLLEIFRALPQMMTRRETFPVFIHGHWHMAEPPDALVKCMSISQLYVNRDSSQHDSAIYYTLRRESSRLARLTPNLTGFDLLAAFEVQVVYTLLVALKDDTPNLNSIPELSVENGQMDRTTRMARKCFHQDSYAPFDIDNICDPKETWEDFIYAESRRRCALVWFLASRVIHLREGSKCPPVLGYRGLALPSPDALWNARRREDWETARAEMHERHQQSLSKHSLRTLGDLVDIRSRSDSNSRRKLSNWSSNCGELGMMLLVASILV